MSVDYTANYGIGYEVEASDEIIESNCMEDGLFEYLYNEIGDGFSCFEVRSCRTGEIEGVYIVIDKPFFRGLNLDLSKIKLDQEIDRLNLRPCGEFDLVGGLTIS